MHIYIYIYSLFNLSVFEIYLLASYKLCQSLISNIFPFCTACGYRDYSSPYFRIFLRCHIYETFCLLGKKCFQYDSKRGKKEISPCSGRRGEWQRSRRWMTWAVLMLEVGWDRCGLGSALESVDLCCWPDFQLMKLFVVWAHKPCGQPIKFPREKRKSRSFYICLFLRSADLLKGLLCCVE